MTTIRDITDHLESIAPLHLQESYDNAGLIVGHPGQEVTGVLCCLDSTEAVVAEAMQLGCNLIVAHHPIVFRGLKRLNGFNYVERTVIKAIRNNIAIYAIHTNLDNVLTDGVNGRIAAKLALRDTEVLAPKTPGDLLVGSGVIGRLAKPMSAFDFLHLLKANMQAGCIKHTALPEKPVQKIAVCGGSGGFLLNNAIHAGADVFVTADYKYHEFFDADGNIVIADIGHYESEQFTIELLCEIISKKFHNFAAHCTKVNTNPVNYL